MKVKIYKHSSIKTPIDDDIKKISIYFESGFVKQFIDEKIDIVVENTTLNYMDDRLFKPNEDSLDVVMFMFEKGTFPVYASANYYSSKLIKCYCSVNPIEDAIDYSWKVFVHELLHALCFKIMVEKNVYIPNELDTYVKNDDPYAPDGNFAKQLSALKQFYPRGWKYFTPTESTGGGHTVAELNKELVDKLDKMRESCGFPFIINSGFRTPEENDALRGSVEDSAHLKGLAVDIKCKTSEQRFKMIKSAYENNIHRIGVGSTFCHFDIDTTKPQRLMWGY